MRFSAKFNAILRLMRCDKPVGTLLLMWGSLWGLWLAGHGLPPAKETFIILLGTWTMRSAGCVFNDLTDRNFDGAVARTNARPLATGELSVKEALVVGVVMLTFSFFLVCLLNWQSVLMSVALAVVAIIYPFCKRFLPTPQAVLGIAFSGGILIAHTAILGHLTWAGFFLFLGCAVWALVYDTFYALVDRDDDIPLNLRSSAIFSQGWEMCFIALMAVIMMVFLTISGVLAHLGGWYYFGLLVGCLLIGQEIYMSKNLEREKCFAAFHHNNWVGATIWAGMILNYLP